MAASHVYRFVALKFFTTIIGKRPGVHIELYIKQKPYASRGPVANKTQ
jgi:hypothetical protein